MRLLVLISLAFIGIAIFVQRRPFLFGLTSEPPDENLEIFTQSDDLDRLLARYETELGKDKVPYQNHCLRVLTFAVHHLKSTYGASDDFIRSSIPLMAAILAYHDIALWSDGILDYLDPSWERFRQDAKDDETQDYIYNDQQMKIAKAAILQHHKITPWSSGNKEEDMLVNAIRMGDWADATYGVLPFGMKIGNIAAVLEAVPEAGFHGVLAGMGPRLSPDSLLGQLDPLKIFKW